MNWDQANLANASGVSRSRISEIERGRATNVGVDAIFALADALNVSPAYLLGQTDDPLEGVVDEEEEAPAPTAGGWPGWAAGLGRELWDAFTGLGAEDQMMLLALARRLKAASTPRVIGGEGEEK